uniref:Uncharacterized protein n=1 Tax=Panagrolaimus davidi TaxID=227884 RepID=A0A914PDN8_9BILA
MNKTFDKTKIKKSDMNIFPGSAILTCVCRETYEPIFFISPYINYVNYDLIAEDAYFYCVLGKPVPALQNINDNGYEIYDNFLFEHIKTIPNTLMTPLKDDDSSEVGCYDKDGFLTKSIGNQQTCFFAFIIGNDSVYSGPLIYSQLSNFGPNVGNVTLEAEPSCYTSVKNSTFKHNDSCIYIPSDSIFICNTSYEDSKFLSYMRTSMQTYLNESVNYACGIKISTKNVTVENNGTVRSGPKFEIEYISLNSCSDETTVDISESKFCSSEALRPENMSVQQCCKSGNFCNLDFITPIKLDMFIFYKCSYKPHISFHFDETTTCELYYDLILQKRVYLHENFTTKIIHKTLYHDYYPTIYRCSFIYAQIINVDSKECIKQIYNEMGEIKPFYHCTCQDVLCDFQGIDMEAPNTNFTCQHLVKTDLKNAKNGVGNFDEKSKWICYVKIDFYFEGSKVNAGHLDINTAKEVMKECFKNHTIVNSKFCCINIVKINQSDTDCTVKKQIERFKENLKNPNNPSENSEHGANSEYITCLPKDILNFESESCPKTGGCFSTRILLPSGITSTDAIEPAGCLGYAEKYATLNLPLTSLSLGCRTNENSNRCSVIYGPNGEQRIVCCCNENNGNGFCNTNLKEVPQSVGRSIKSFKSLN